MRSSQMSPMFASQDLSGIPGNPSAEKLALDPNVKLKMEKLEMVSLVYCLSHHKKRLYFGPSTHQSHTSQSRLARYGLVGKQ